MSGMFRRHRKATAAVVGVSVAVLGAVSAWAYWTSGGSGTGTQKNAGTVSDVVVSQTVPTSALAPGNSVALSGLLTNTNKTDIKLGVLTATITGVDGGAAVGDFSLTGNPVTVNAVVKGNTALAWSGMTLVYGNSAVNQDAGKNATVSISYTVAPFQEPTALPDGTVQIVNGVVDVVNVSTWKTGASTSLAVANGDTLYVIGGSGAGFGLVATAVNGKINYHGTVSTAGQHYLSLHQLTTQAPGSENYWYPYT